MKDLEEIARKLRRQLYGAVPPLPEDAAPLAEAERLKEQILRLCDAGDLVQALALCQRALRLYEQALGPDHPGVAITLHSMGALHEDVGQYQEAVACYERALAIWEECMDPRVTKTLTGLGLLHTMLGRYREAEPLLQRAVQIHELEEGPDDPAIGVALDNLAHLYMAMGQYQKAELLSRRGLDLIERALGPDHLTVARALSNLAQLNWEMGQYQKAELLYERALRIHQQVLQPDDPEHAVLLTNIGMLYHRRGQWDRAEEPLRRALQIREAALGPAHPAVARSLNNLAGLYQVQGRHGEAEPLFQRALGVLERTMGSDHPSVASLRDCLSISHFQQGDSAGAEALARRALDDRQRVLGADHPDVGLSMHNLAVVLSHRGEHQRADALFQDAIENRQSALGPDHPDVAIVLSSHAFRRIARGQIEEAVPLFERVLVIQERLLHQADTEHVMMALLGISLDMEQASYTLATQQADDPTIRRLAASTALLRKGRAADQGAQLAASILQARAQQQQTERFAALQALRGEISRLYRTPPASLPDYRRQLQDAESRLEHMERELAWSAGVVGGPELPGPHEIASRIAAALPGDGVLVEFVAFAPAPFSHEGSVLGKPGEMRYLALVMFPDERLTTIDLGPAGAINDAVWHLRHCIRQPLDDSRGPAQNLHRLVLGPLLGTLDGRTELFVSPDGSLNIVPFSALHDGSDYLVERYQFTYLNSGRDLLDGHRPAGTAQGVTVLADPEFAEGVPRLPGTAREAEMLAGIFPDATLLLGESATKQALFEVRTPRILHVATHAAFRRDWMDSPYSAERNVLLLPERPLWELQLRQGQQDHVNPMSQAELLLAGPGADGRASALELCGLDLQGTELVVLSACETGLGQVQIGQGVYGLRRAFFIAGGRTLVTSLWKVEDESTSELMRTFYKCLQQQQSAAESLRQASRSMRQRHEQPYYWAPFVVLGGQAASVPG